MSADQFLTLDGRPTVRVERRYPHRIEKVWRAVTTPEHLGQWFPSPVEIELRPGGSMRFGVFSGDAGAAGIVEAVDAPRRLAFTWGADRLTFELVPDGDGTTFSVTHSFDDRYGAPSFATGWELCLAGLRCVLDGEPLAPPDRGIARHEELVHEFGLDRPEVTQCDDGWTVRVERQLTCPAEVAWDLWFGYGSDGGSQRVAPAVGGTLTHYMPPEVVTDRMTDVERHRLLALNLASTGAPGDRLRVELNDGTGHGTRITLTVTGSDPGERDTAAELWGTGAIGHLAASAAEWAMAQPTEVCSR